MRWPWAPRKPERRDQPFTDAITSALFTQATGTTAGDPGAIAALEAAAGLYAHAFAGAIVTPAEARAVLTPAVLALIARDLIRRGENVHQVTIEGATLRLQAIGSWDVRGGPREADWWYRCDRFGPSGNSTELVPSSAVVHSRYAIDSARPWFGIGPLGWARSSAALAAGLETRLAEEAAGPVGHVIAVPTDGGAGGDDDPLAGLKKDLANAKGRTLIAETTSAGWGEGRAAAPLSDYKPQRFGASPPDALPTLRTDAALSVLAACQVPPALFHEAQGVAQREAWRRWAMGPLAGLAAIVAAELSLKLDRPIRLGFDQLWAHDLAGRAAAFQKMVAAGLSIERAAALAGVLEEEAA